jgi:hypothetical protein
MAGQNTLRIDRKFHDRVWNRNVDKRFVIFQAFLIDPFQLVRT